MDIFGTYHILDDGDYIGEMNVYAQGMMTVFEGSCKTEREGPFRVAALSDGFLIMLGVMLPRDGGYYLRRSFTKNAINELGIKRINEFRIIYPELERRIESEPAAADEQYIWKNSSEPWRLFADEELSEICRDVTGGLQRREENGDISFAVPVERGVPFPAMPIFCFGTYMKIKNKSYVVFRIRNGELIQ